MSDCVLRSPPKVKTLLKRCGAPCMAVSPKSMMTRMMKSPNQKKPPRRREILWRYEGVPIVPRNLALIATGSMDLTDSSIFGSMDFSETSFSRLPSFLWQQVRSQSPGLTFGQPFFLRDTCGLRLTRFLTGAARCCCTILSSCQVSCDFRVKSHAGD